MKSRLFLIDFFFVLKWSKLLCWCCRRFVYVGLFVCLRPSSESARTGAGASWSRWCRAGAFALPANRRRARSAIDRRAAAKRRDRSRSRQTTPRTRTCLRRSTILDTEEIIRCFVLYYFFFVVVLRNNEKIKNQIKYQRHRPSELTLKREWLAATQRKQDQQPIFFF